MNKDSAEQPNPFELDIAERTMPEGLSKAGQKEWVRNISALQAEGVANGVRPQGLRGVPEEFMGSWNRIVWRPYLRTLSNRDRKSITVSAPGRKKHSHPQFGGPAPTTLKLPNGRPVDRIS